MSAEVRNALGGFERYAIYYAPEPGSALARFAAGWFGWDMDAGAPSPRLEIGALPEPIEALTERPGRYGAHGTLKAPFRLARHASPAELDVALRMFAASAPALQAPPLCLSVANGFVSLVPDGRADELDALAAAVVQSFDRFRAPLTDEERARRDPASLTAAQRANLERWGYPYVLGQFRFHITLTKALEAPAARRVATVLEPKLGAILDREFAVGDLCLFGDPGGGARFKLLHRYPLRPGA